MGPDRKRADVGAFYRGHVTVTPIKLDWTDQAELPKLEPWGFAERKNEEEGTETVGVRSQSVQSLRP